MMVLKKVLRLLSDQTFDITISVIANAILFYLQLREMKKLEKKRAKSSDDGIDYL